MAVMHGVVPTGSTTTAANGTVSANGTGIAASGANSGIILNGNAASSPDTPPIPPTLIPPQPTAATPLQIIFRSLNTLGAPSAVSHTSQAPAIYSGAGEYIASGVRYRGVLGREMGLLGLLPWGILPQTHYGSTSVSGMPIPKEGLPMISTGSSIPSTQPGVPPQPGNPTKRTHNNIFYASGVRILASEGGILPQHERHPEMYETIGVEEYLEENGVSSMKSEPDATPAPPKATPYHMRHNRRLALPFKSKQQDILPFDFGSKGWAHTSFVYGNLNTAMSLASISKYDSEESGGTGTSSRSAASQSGVHQRDFPDLNLIKMRMERIARMYQVEITPQCIQMMIRAMETHIKTVLENCIRARREDELERVQRVDVDPRTYDLRATEDLNSVSGSPVTHSAKAMSSPTNATDDPMEDDDEAAVVDSPSVPTQIDKLPLAEHLIDTEAISTSTRSISRNTATRRLRRTSDVLDSKLERDALYGTYLKKSRDIPSATHSYFHYKDEYEHKILEHQQEELSQHPKVHRIITAKCLLSVLEMKPHLVAGNADWSAKLREKVLHSNWDLPYD